MWLTRLGFDGWKVGMRSIKYYNYFFYFVLILSLVFVGFVIVDAGSVNSVLSGKNSFVVIWVFMLTFAFVLKEFLDFWFVDRSQSNLLKVVLESIGLLFFAYILVGAL